MRVAAALSALAAIAGGCVRSASTTAPTDLGAPPRPTVACPAPVVSQTLTGLPIIVTFGQPQATGGVLPLAATCSPPSGAAFPIGTTTVTCTVTDALKESATCRFTVRVLGPPRLSATNFLAFGDSITAGQTFDTYPSRLLGKLRARYQTQDPGVFNDGLNGETAVGGRQRLPFALDAHRPGVLLLIEGSNDLLAGAAGATRALDALTDMVRLAKGRGVVVMLGTIPPQRLGGSRDAVARMIPGFNDNVRAIAQREGATLVDIYAAMVGDPSLIGPDDLHPTAQGHEVMAQTFFTVVQQTLELPPE